MRISEHDLWTDGGNTVVVLPPSRDDLFVAALVNGHAAWLWPITRYDEAVRTAHMFTRCLRAVRPVTIKVLALTAAEARAFGLIPNLSCAPTATDDAERAELVASLTQLLRDSNDPLVRTDAYGLLRDMGEVP